MDSDDDCCDDCLTWLDDLHTRYSRRHSKPLAAKKDSKLPAVAIKTPEITIGSPEMSREH